MPTALDMAGPILEMLTWLCLPAGLMLLVYAGILRRFINPWVVAEGVVYSDATGTGFRWFDMRRLSVDPVYKATVGTSHSLYSATGATSTFILRPDRLVLRFPQKIIDSNPGLNNNP